LRPDSLPAAGQRAERGRPLKVLCVGNGGLVRTAAGFSTHRSMAEFLVGLAREAATVGFCHWVEPDDDPLARTALECTDDFYVVPLEPVSGSLPMRGVRASAALVRLVVAIARADFVYIYWPGTLAEVACKVCIMLRRPYGLYLRGGDDANVSAISQLLRRATFAFTAGARLLTAARMHCPRVDAVSPMVSIRPHHLERPHDLPLGRVPRLLYVGRIEASKGIPELLEAQRMLAARGIATEVVLVGQCYESSVLPPGAESDPGLRVVGPVTDFDALAEHYRSSDIFVLPSHSEGFPRVLYEAMAFGLPIVTTFVGGIASVLADGQSCLRVEVGNATDLASKLERLCREPTLGLQIATEAQSTLRALMPTWVKSHADQVLAELAEMPKPAG
jgi:glycosyltransferase involved in cell wall biosynthesis